MFDTAWCSFEIRGDGQTSCVHGVHRRFIRYQSSWSRSLGQHLNGPRRRLTVSDRHHDFTSWPVAGGWSNRGSRSSAWGGML